MAENYKVNFRTKINEFKRKHNKLVDGIVSGEIGGTKLYKHDILITQNSSDFADEIIVLSTNNTIVKDAESFDAVIFEATSRVFVGNGTEMLVIDFENSQIGRANLTTFNALGVIDYSEDGTNFQDTVSPL